MNQVSISLPPELWQQVEEYRRLRGRQLGIPTIDKRIALLRLLQQGLIASSLEVAGAADEPVNSSHDGPAVPQAAERGAALPSPHFVPQGIPYGCSAHSMSDVPRL
jgi:hypothetical protein